MTGQLPAGLIGLAIMLRLGLGERLREGVTALDGLRLRRGEAWVNKSHKLHKHGF